MKIKDVDSDKLQKFLDKYKFNISVHSLDPESDLPPCIDFLEANKNIFWNVTSREDFITEYGKLQGLF